MRLALVLFAVAVLGACGPFRQTKLPPPPGPVPVRIPEQVTSMEPAPPPKTLPPPPPIGTPIPADAKPAMTTAIGLPSTPKAPPPRKISRKKQTAKRVRKPALTSTPAEPLAPALDPAPETAPPTYRLGEVRTPEEKVSLRLQAERMISFCSAVLTATARRPLTPAQLEMAERVKTFSKQAKEALDRDPGEARNLAAKGRSFAEALLSELK